jgi:hypothetical protein
MPLQNHTVLESEGYQEALDRRNQQGTQRDYEEAGRRGARQVSGGYERRAHAAGGGDRASSGSRTRRDYLRQAGAMWRRDFVERPVGGKQLLTQMA